MSHAAGRDQQGRRRGPLLLLGLEAMLAEVERHLAQRAHRLIRHDIILPHRRPAGARGTQAERGANERRPGPPVNRDGLSREVSASSATG